MKWAKREAYYLLTKIDFPKPFNGTLGLCHFCKYAEWSGSACSGESNVECSHPLEWAVAEHAFEVLCGDDCWGFRPLYTHETAVDIVGLLLRGHWPDYDAIPVLGKATHGH